MSSGFEWDAVSYLHERRPEFELRVGGTGVMKSIEYTYNHNPKTQEKRIMFQPYEHIALVDSNDPNEEPFDVHDALSYLFARTAEEAKKKAIYEAITQLNADFDADEAADMAARLRVIVRPMTSAA
jgi:hypothetical protein